MPTKPFLLLISVLAVMCCQAQKQKPQWEIPIYFEDAKGSKDTVWVGYDKDATPFFGEFDAEFEIWEKIDTSEFNVVVEYNYFTDSANMYAVSSNLKSPIQLRFFKGELPMIISWDDSLLNSDSIPFWVEVNQHGKAWIRNDWSLLFPKYNTPCGHFGSYVFTGDSTYIERINECLVQDSLVLTSHNNMVYTAENTAGEIEIVIIPLDEELTVGLGENQKGSFEIYPNPTQNELFLEFADESQQHRITIHNNLGVVVRIIETHESKTGIDVGGLPSGIYFVSMQTEKGTIIRKIIKR